MNGRRNEAHTHTNSISNLLIPISKMEMLSRKRTCPTPQAPELNSTALNSDPGSSSLPSTRFVPAASSYSLVLSALTMCVVFSDLCVATAIELSFTPFLLPLGRHYALCEIAMYVSEHPQLGCVCLCVCV